MAQVIQFIPRRTSPSGLLRAARKRSGMTAEQFASRLGELIGRPQLSPGTIRAWEDRTIAPPVEVVEAAQKLARAAPTTVGLYTSPATPALIEPLGLVEASTGRMTVEA